MTIEQIYLGWCGNEGPPAIAARRLLDDAPVAADGSANLAASLIVVSSGRVMRHLRYAILEEARRRGIPLIPAQMCTVESLGARALGVNFLAERATSADWLIALERALSELSSDAAELLLPRGLPSTPGSRFSITRQLQSVIDQATSANRSPAEIMEMLVVAESPSAQRRWRSLQQLVDSAERIIETSGDRRPLSALSWNRDLIERGTASIDRVILLGVIDATPVTRAILGRLESLGTRISAWIVAPEDRAGIAVLDEATSSVLDEATSSVLDEATSSWFDEIGCIRSGALLSGPPLRDDQIEPAEGPQDQCDAVIARYSSIAQKLVGSSGIHETQDPGSIVIVNGEPALNSVLGRTVEAHGRSAHFGSGKAFHKTLAGMLLRAIARLNASPHPDALVPLLSHPCVSECMARRGARFDPVCELDNARAGSLVNELEHLESLGGDWRDAKGGALMSQVRALFGRFVPETVVADGLSTWSQLSYELASTIRRVLHGSLGDPVQEAGCAAIARLADRVGDGIWSNAVADVGTVVAFMDAMLTDVEVPIPPDGYEVEVIGWLDSLFEPSSSMVLMGIREGTIPSAPIPDGWLNEALRTELKLADRSQRLARDAYVLRAIVARTAEFVIVSGQTNALGDPMTPSRLLFPARGLDQARRMRRLLDMGGEGSRRPEAALNARTSGFFGKPIPEDYPNLSLPECLSITNFKSYIESPYIFWLDHIMGLSATGVPSGGSTSISLDPMQFGSIVHEALAQLRDPTIKDSSDRQELRAFLVEWIRREFARKFGKHPKAGVILQLEIAIERVCEAIEWHLSDRETGWVLQASEWSFPDETLIDVDGKAQAIRGRIDRIDRNERSGEWRIIDYKTGDTAPDPEKATRSDGEFIDLQLPLYQALAPLHYPGMVGSVPLVGYVSVAAAPSEVSFLGFDLTHADRAEALRVAGDVIRAIRTRKFGSPNDFKPNFFSSRDDAVERLLRRSCFEPIVAEATSP